MTFWHKTVEILRGQYGVYMDPRTAYQRCHDLQYDSFGSVQGLLESMRDYQCIAPQNSQMLIWNLYSEIRFLSRCKRKLAK